MTFNSKEWADLHGEPREQWDNPREDVECCETCGKNINECLCQDCPECGETTPKESLVADPRNNQDDLICDLCAKLFVEDIEKENEDFETKRREDQDGGEEL